ncbi:RDD family protein [Acidovorax facilis]|uniref:RDD family protein n=1 Tax=Acidovorax facilis TaxID=12917 RepID=A0ABV8D663_9BURK|nr:RDD family protein [Acidovorax facilis]MCO4240592.1 RDD family protein [Acidovorax facilis]
MAYEDPNAPSPAPGDVAQQSNAPVDQSKTFLGGEHHPWRRLFARTVDICTAGLVLFLLLIFAFSATMPEQAAGFAKAIENPIIASVVLYLIWLPAEALLLSLFGTTPAKWLFGIRVAHPGGDLLSFSDALNRSFLVFVQGVGFGIPFVALFTQLFAYRRLTKTGTTLWDTSASAVVLHTKWGVFRALVCTAAVFAVLILMSALNAAGK